MIRLSKIAIQTDGRIVAAGQINTNPTLSNSNDYLVARYLADSPPATSTAATDAALMILLNEDLAATNRTK